MIFALLFGLQQDNLKDPVKRNFANKMNLKTNSALTAGAVFLALILGCKIGSASSDAVRDTQPENSTSTASSRVENPDVKEPIATPTPVSRTNDVCPDPAKPCNHKDKHFDDWELSFKMPARLQANKTNSSAPFYGIILKTYALEDDCDGGEYIEAIEAERKRLQHEYPERKVFASYECPNMAAVNYDFPGRWDAKKETILISNFLAIYAGKTKEEADELLGKIRAKYPDAQLKQMTANYEWIVQ
jgi:hypothetical protein